MSFMKAFLDKIGIGDDELDDSKLHLLHGRLHFHVICAEGLPDTDTVFFNIDGKDVTDPYVTANLGEARLFCTKYIPNELNPRWDETFSVPVCHRSNVLTISVKDKEHVGNAHIASCEIAVEELISGEEIEEKWFDLMNGDDNQGRIQLSVRYTAKEDLEEAGELSVPNTYFEARAGNRVVLYQDADTPQLPIFDGVTSPDGSPYIATTAWKDTFEAIQNAQKFIYVTGWSVYTAINLVRGMDDPENASNIGELLKRKADEGVKVLVMVWNEKLSTEGSPGLMGTHDEETRLFFAGTNVECHAVSRMKLEGILASNFVGTCYTHHQKNVILDVACPEDESRRQVAAFIGGLDLTNGRYDTPEFHLWRTIKTHHAGDFYNNCTLGVTENTGPRQPWHDCHALVIGPTARDIMKNFEERWRRQVEDYQQSLIHLGDDEFNLDDPPPMPENEGSLWNVQLFRSITSDSCLFDFEKHERLFSKSGRYVEDSIMRCTVQQIRNAQKFIYLENQYFMGSAYSWYGDKKTLSMHIVPREITQKIVEKIAAGEPFKVYAVIPMFPEGDPASAAVQEILFWQYRTMETMYRHIGKAIAEFGAEDAHPTDYLNFYCLAKRESEDEMPEGEFEDPPGGSLAEKVRQTRRHCVYVHCKMTLFDDRYVLVGSANINQRSMGGNRDTEIAVGCYQPDNVDLDAANGGVHTYRSALWAAHLGGTDPAYQDPSSQECLDKVREVTRGFWELYTADEPRHSDVHMLPYPITVDNEGNVSALESPYDCFPDTQAKVLGAKSGYLPGKLTT